MPRTITSKQLRQQWLEKREVALVDVREEGPYADGHPLFAISVPISEIEERLPSFVPRLSAPIVVYDDGEGFAECAARRLTKLGYLDVSVLDGGLSAYARVGEIYRDVNVASKAFGELVEAIRGTPLLPAAELKKILDEREDVVVVDARRFEEFNTMSISRGRSCPGGELVYRILDAAPDPETLVVVNWTSTFQITTSHRLPFSRMAKRRVDTPGGPDAIWPSRLKERSHIPVVDIARSTDYRKGHLSGAYWASGPNLMHDLKRLPPSALEGTIVLTSPDGRVAGFNYREAQYAIVQPKFLYVQGGTRARVSAGFELETECRWLSEPRDVYKRPYEGTDNQREKMQGYIDWELGLVKQLANDGVAGFHVVREIGEEGGRA